MSVFAMFHEFHLVLLVENIVEIPVWATIGPWRIRLKRTQVRKALQNTELAYSLGVQSTTKRMV